jgi:hypothetical protein
VLIVRLSELEPLPSGVPLTVSEITPDDLDKTIVSGDVNVEDKVTFPLNRIEPPINIDTLPEPLLYTSRPPAELPPDTKNEPF